VQIAVLSDMHLGRKDGLDQFARNPGAESRLYNLLNYLEGHVDKIVLLGDIFEVYRSKWFGNWAFERELDAVMHCYPQIALKILCDPQYELVQGNHDFPTKKLLRAREFYEIDADGKKLLFLHGHQFDAQTEDFWARHFEKFGCWAGGWLERMGMDLTAKMNLKSKIKSLNDEWSVSKFERLAAEFGKSRGADIVITGHSHHPMKAEIDGVLFMNSGTRVAGRQDLLLLDTATDSYEVHKKFNFSSQNEISDCS
jgi:predicted phosphodiesterase